MREEIKSCCAVGEGSRIFQLNPRLQFPTESSIRLLYLITLNLRWLLLVSALPPAFHLSLTLPPSLSLSRPCHVQLYDASIIMRWADVIIDERFFISRIHQMWSWVVLEYDWLVSHWALSSAFWKVFPMLFVSQTKIILNNCIFLTNWANSMLIGSTKHF